MMPDEADLNKVLDDINDISVVLFEARETFKTLYPNTPEGALGSIPSTPAYEAINKLNEATMLIDDVMAIIVDEMGGVFEGVSYWTEGDDERDIGGEG